MKYPVLLPIIFDYPFTYKSNLNLKVGEYVKVSFGKSKITGVIWDKFEKNNNKIFKIKEIDKRLNIKPLKKETIKFLNWFSEYNLVPKGMSLKLHLLSGEAIENFDDKEGIWGISHSGLQHGVKTRLVLEYDKFWKPKFSLEEGISKIIDNYI